MEDMSSYTEYIGVERGTRGTETSKYPEEKKTKVIPEVAASEPGEAQTSFRAGVVGLRHETFNGRRMGLEAQPKKVQALYSKPKGALAVS